MSLRNDAPLEFPISVLINPVHKTTYLRICISASSTHAPGLVLLALIPSRFADIIE